MVKPSIVEGFLEVIGLQKISGYMSVGIATALLTFLPGPSLHARIMLRQLLDVYWSYCTHCSFFAYQGVDAQGKVLGIFKELHVYHKTSHDSELM